MFLSIPLSKELLEWLLLAGGPAATAAIAAAWMVGKAHSTGENRALKAECDFLKLRSTAAEIDLDKLKVSHERGMERIGELALENSRLTAEIEALGRASSSPEALKHSRLIDELKTKLRSFDDLKDALLGAEDEVWKLRPPSPREDFAQRMRQSRTKVLLVANLKGGVGKTTVVANLAAHFALARGKRVLAIDLDYQGSLTRMMVLGAHLQLGGSILADTLLSGDASGSWLVQAARDLNAALPKSKLVTCGPVFDGFENRALLRWLLSEIADDIRYRLAEILLSKPVQDEIDIVLIDAPPRQSLGTVNALCASHALVIPTVPDAMSVDGTARFLQRANLFRSLNPALEYAGVVASLTEVSKLKPHEQKAMDDAKLALAHWNGRGQLFKRNIRHFASLSRAAGREIGYMQDDAVREVFDELGREVSEAWQL